MDIDAQVPLSAVTRQTVSWIERLAPFGEGNPAPTFLSNGVGVRQAKTVGADNAHLRLDLDGWSAIGWRLGQAAPNVGSQVDIIWRLRRGLRGQPELEIIDPDRVATNSLDRSGLYSVQQHSHHPLT